MVQISSLKFMTFKEIEVFHRQRGILVGLCSCLFFAKFISLDLLTLTGEFETLLSVRMIFLRNI